MNASQYECDPVWVWPSLSVIRQERNPTKAQPKKSVVYDECNSIW